MTWTLVAAGYLAGSVPFGVLVTRVFAGQDVRAAGSGNIGATNVARVAGKGLGALVLALDAAKGAVPVWLAVRLSPELPLLHVAVAAAAFLGHVFPVWLRFQGGKGVATALGVLLVLLPESAGLGFVVWLVVLATTRISSVGSLLGALVAVTSAFFFGRPLPYALLGVGLLAAMLWTHRGNLSRLLRRAENRV
jgi:glycerol-3-phosphate acyltransferase PlsY